MSTPTQLSTRRGAIQYPAYIPVTTFGDRYPLDGLIRPYLPRIAPAVMVSYHYARQMKHSEQPGLPLLVDSGGFASLFKDLTIHSVGDLGVLDRRTAEGLERIHPMDVLEFQESVADVAFTLDFPIPPGMDPSEALERQRLTIANAEWAVSNRRRQDLPLFACVQGWDRASYRACAAAYDRLAVDGLAVGGLVPRSSNVTLLEQIVGDVLLEARNKPVHVFGIGKPDLVRRLFELGVSSVDSSSYVKLAADGRLWSQPDFCLEDAAPLERLELALRNLMSANSVAVPLSVQLRNLRVPAKVETALR